jgi:KDO2-lipid IV(A) lauroyltransferase
MASPIRRLYKTSPRLRRVSRESKDAVLAQAARLGLWLGARLSLERGLQVAEVLGGVLYRALGTPRRLADAHLKLAFGETLTPADRERVARACFVNVARSFIELVKIDEIRARGGQYIEAEGHERLEALLRLGKGLIVITGHVGNWELLAAYWAWQGTRIAAVARRIYVPEINRLLVDFRARQGVETILREDASSARQILRALKSNSVLAMLIDQDTKAPSVSVPFFGHPARTPLAAATLAIRRDTPVAPAFIQRRPRGGHRVVLHPPIAIERSGDMAADVRALTQKCSAALEGQIRSNPTEWVWWHRRWRHQPHPRLDMDADFQYTNQDAVLRGGG